jgi:hypothetical protein
MVIMNKHQQMISTIYDITMILLFITIFIITHIVFKNIREISIWSCKLITTCLFWSIIWVATQLHHLPEWKNDFKDSLWQLMNMTKTEL